VMDILQNLLDSSTYSFLTAFILGLMTAVSPCPLATNISAIGYISRTISNRKRVFYNGLIYTLGRGISYTVLAVILFFGVNKLQLSMLFQGWGEKLLGPVLILIGLFLLDILKIKFPALSRVSEKMGEKSRESYWGTLFLGMVFALAFCPYSGVLYFAMLMPMTISSVEGLYLPMIYAAATGLPVVLFAWLLAFTVGQVGTWYHRIQLFEKWFRRAISVVFIIVGIYFVLTLLIV
jgi:cytochrome c biogenesis protein CcdA